MRQVHCIVYFLLILLYVMRFGKVNCVPDAISEAAEDEDDEENCDANEQPKPSRIEDFVGTNLFGDDGCVKRCFSTEDVALLSARKEFEFLLPKDLDKCLMNDDSVELMMQYFYGVNQIIHKMANGNSKMYTQKAYYDALGGYLNWYLAPVTRLSFYAGVLTLKATIRVTELLQQSKTNLNVYGSGWRPPIVDFSDFELIIEPLKPATKDDDGNGKDIPCLNLNLADDQSENDEEMIVLLPKLDPEDDGVLTNIWLPFKRRHSFNLQSPLSAFILIRYYVAVSKCYAFQSVCQKSFNHRFKNWIQENIESHLNDEVLYPGLGAILRVLETFKHAKKANETKDKRSKVPRHCVVAKTPLAAPCTVATNATKSQPKKTTKLSLFARLFSFGKKSNVINGNDLNGNLTDDDDNDDDDESSKAVSQDRSGNEILMIIIIVLLIVLIVIFLIAIIWKYMSVISRREDKPKEPKETVQTETGGENNEKRKPGGFSGFMDRRRFRHRKFNQDEEIALKSDSSSIMSSNRCNYRQNAGNCKGSSRRVPSTDAKSTPTFCISDETSPSDPKNRFSISPKSSNEDEIWHCCNCSRLIDFNDPIYIRNPECPTEERKCLQCSTMIAEYVSPPHLFVAKKAKKVKNSPLKKLLGAMKEENRYTSKSYDKPNSNWNCIGCVEGIGDGSPIYEKDPKLTASYCGYQSSKWRCTVCLKIIEESDPIHLADSTCPPDKRKCFTCSKNDIKNSVNKNWICISCEKPIKNDDTIYFRDPNCPKEKRKCSGCHGRELVKFNCISCARPIKDVVDQNGTKQGRRCDKCKANWICTSCGEPIRLDDPIHIENPDCPIDERKCQTCCQESKEKYICVTCTKPIKDDDPIYSQSDANCVADKRKCADCSKVISPKRKRLEKLSSLAKTARKFSVTNTKNTERANVSVNNKIQMAKMKNEGEVTVKQQSPVRRQKRIGSSTAKSPIKVVADTKAVTDTKAATDEKPATDQKATTDNKAVTEDKKPNKLEAHENNSDKQTIIRGRSFDAGKFMLPKDLDKCLLNDEAVETLMQYFYGTNQIILKMTEGNRKLYAQKAFYDTLGGYLNYYLLPITKLSFYAGVITLKTTRRVLDLLDQCKIYLNSNGNGWKPPLVDFDNFEMSIESLHLFDKPPENENTVCSNLNLADERSGNDEDMIISLPKLDPEEMGKLTNIWLPFKRKHSFNLKSKASAFVLTRYFVMVSKCYHHQNVCQEKFNKHFKKWLDDNIVPHMNDEVLYPGLGAILRIIETINHKDDVKKQSSLEEKSVKQIRDSANLYKNKQGVKSKLRKSSGSKPKHNFLEVFLNNEPDNLYVDDKSPEDTENYQIKHKNYIIAAVAVAIILMIFVCLVAIVTKNVREICKSRQRLKAKKKKMQAAEIDARKRSGMDTRFSKRKHSASNQMLVQSEKDGNISSPAVNNPNILREYSSTTLEKYDCETKAHSLFFPACQKRSKPPEFQLELPHSPPSSETDKYCQNCNQQIYNDKEYRSKMGLCLTCYCDANQQSATLPTTVSKPMKCKNCGLRVHSEKDYRAKGGSCISCFSKRLSNGGRPSPITKRVAQRIKPIRNSPSPPPKFSISKKSKRSEAGAQSNGSPIRGSSMPQPKYATATQVLCRTPVNTPCPSRIMSPQSSPPKRQQCLPCPAAKSRQGSLSPSGIKRMELASSSWETLDSRK